MDTFLRSLLVVDWCRSLTDELLRTPLASDFKVLLKVTIVANEIAIVKQDLTQFEVFAKPLIW